MAALSDVLLRVGRLNYVWTNTESLLIYVIAHLLRVEKDAAITDWEARELELDLSFLPAGKFVLDENRDGVNADRSAEDYVREQRSVTTATKLKLKLAEGGGWAARIRRE